MITSGWWKQPVHISWFVAALSGSFVIGVALSATTKPSFELTPVYLIVLSLLLPSLFFRRRYLIAGVLIAGVLLGLLRGGHVQQALASYEQYYQKVITVGGRVQEDTSFGPKGDQRLRINNVRIEGVQFAGSVWVTLSQPADIKRGDIVIINGQLHEGFGSTAATLFRGKIETITRPSPGDVGRQVRDWFAGGVYAALPKSDGDFALAFLLGQKLELPEDIGDQLRTVGLIHAVVASGYHLTVLVGVIRRLCTHISKYLTFLLSYGMITGFIAITGLSPSMTRAGIVSGLGLLAWYYGRRFHPVILLSVAAAITVLYNPQYVWGDLGWYLSFSSFVGVLLLSPLLQAYFFGDKKPSLLREIIVITIAAQLMTLPITIAAFGYYSIYAVLANVLVVPLVPLIMLFTFITGILGILFVPVAKLSGILVSGLLEYVSIVVGWIVTLPSAKSEVSFGTFGIVLSYVILLLLMVCLHKVTKYDFRSSQIDKHLF